MKNVKTFNVSFPAELARQIDAMASKQFGSRSDFLRTAAVRYLQEEREFEELMSYGKEIGKQNPNITEDSVAQDITAARRKKESWRKTI